jgi:hypothetical protein
MSDIKQDSIEWIDVERIRVTKYLKACRTRVFGGLPGTVRSMEEISLWCAAVNRLGFDNIYANLNFVQFTCQEMLDKLDPGVLALAELVADKPLYSELYDTTERAVCSKLRRIKLALEKVLAEASEHAAGGE